MSERKRSASMLAESKKYLAGGVSSNVRASIQPPPLFLERGSGSRLWDVDGNEYIDYVLGQGPLILGHTPPAVIKAVQEALERGQLYAGQHELEIVLSRKLVDLLPCADLVRFSNSGSEAVHGALRLARAYTGRQKFIKFEGQYHGWFDNILISLHPSPEEMGPRSKPNKVLVSLGQPDSVYGDLIVLPWNDLDLFEATVEEERGEIAAVITEPIMCNTSCILPKEGYLERVREVCSRERIVLIFDEIITGFRVGLQGAQGYLGVTPDIATFGKAMAAGFPVSCIAGKREIMDLIASLKVTHSGTFNSNVMAMASCNAALKELEKGNGEVYKRMYKLGERLMKGLKDISKRVGANVLVQGLGPAFFMGFTERQVVAEYRDFFDCDVERYHRFAELLLDEGVRIVPRGIWYLSAAHTEEDIERTLGAVERVLQRL